MWQLYDKLIDEIPGDITVSAIHSGPTWTIVRAGEQFGIAVTVNEQNLPAGNYDYLIGSSLRDTAALCKSWDFMLASVGTAALNAFHNSTQRVTAQKDCHIEYTENTFDDYAKEASGKKAAVIGHFFDLERFLKTAESITVLERNPGSGDYPDSACEFVLPHQDLTFITGSAFINKTLPRLLQLCERGKAIVLGPSTPMSPVLFEHGADELCGLIVNEIPDHLIEEIGADRAKLKTVGERVKMTKEPK